MNGPRSFWIEYTGPDKEDAIPRMSEYPFNPQHHHVDKKFVLLGSVNCSYSDIIKSLHFALILTSPKNWANKYNLLNKNCRSFASAF